MKKNTEYGTVHILEIDSIYQRLTERLIQALSKDNTTIGLTGGSTPKAWYEWVIRHDAVAKDLAARATWCTSDERMVPLTSPDSNFGNADKYLLTPLNVPASQKMPWKTHLEPRQAVMDFNSQWTKRFGSENCFDLCFLGMGDDAHIASLFPHNNIVGGDIPDSFTSANVPEKGMRLTITQQGLYRCKEIIITVIGHNKTQALQKVMQAPFNPVTYPAQILRHCSEKVTWLVDSQAGSFLA